MRRMRRGFRNLLLGLCLLVLFTWLAQLLTWEYLTKDLSSDPFYWVRGEIQQRGYLLLKLVTIVNLSAIVALGAIIALGAIVALIGWVRRRWMVTN